MHAANSDRRGLSSSKMALAASLAGVVLAALAYARINALNDNQADAAGPPGRAAAKNPGLDQIPFDGREAYGYLKEICALGTRVSGSRGMEKQRELLANHFEKLGGKVSLQRFRVPHPFDHSAVAMVNLVVEWHPDRTERILLCTHYDTRPYPDRDRREPHGVFLGANDGGSGTAILMQLAKAMPALGGRAGVDFALFDGEELVYDENHPYCLGSEFFAREYVGEPPAHRYRVAVLLDMVGDKQLNIHQEVASARWRDSRPFVDQIWGTAKRLGVREFIASPRYEVNDDHVKLHGIGGIPACDIIDFDYPHWHTTQDTVENCSPLSLAKVGWVVQEWLTAAVQK